MKPILQKAFPSQINEIFSLYKAVVAGVAKTPVNLGWNTEVYPSLEWVTECVNKNEMLIFSDNESIIGACAVNYSVNEEYNQIDWKIKTPAEKISTIHAFCVHPDYWKSGTSSAFLKEVLDYCRKNGDAAIHLDVIDTNDKAMKLYVKAGFEEIDRIEMFYEVVGTRKFWMLEYVFEKQIKMEDLLQGDLLFMIDSSDISKAITGIDQNSIYSHVGIFFDNKVYHATQKKGVNKQLLREYLEEEKKIVSVYRYSDINAEQAREEAEKYLGLPYNHGFYPEDKGLYCSQYIAKILPIFETVPMKFGDGTNEISDYWKDYYKKLESEVPLNQSGTNPFQLSKSEKLEYMGKLEQ